MGWTHDEAKVEMDPVFHEWCWWLRLGYMQWTRRSDQILGVLSVKLRGFASGLDVGVERKIEVKKEIFYFALTSVA